MSIVSGYNHHMVTLYLNGNPPWLKVFGDDQKPRVVLVTVLTSLILLLYDGLMVSHVIIHKLLERFIIAFTENGRNAHVAMFYPISAAHRFLFLSKID